MGAGESRGSRPSPFASGIAARFADIFGESPPLMVRAPGRVNLIGEHTDYNDGFVLPMAIDRAAWIALRPRTDRMVRVYSADYDAWMETDLASTEAPPTGPGRDWSDYVRAMAWAMSDFGLELRGWEGVLGGDVPIGAGLSSSAAVELATARAFALVANLAWDPSTMAVAAQRAENEWIGVRCGIMDQMISASARGGHALLIDCRSLAARPVALPAEAVVVILDTGTRRELTESRYNDRRAECEAAARQLGASSLRDVSPAALAAHAGDLDPIGLRRARHVVGENERTLQVADSLQRGDALRVGQLMQAGHASLRDDFEVSSPELDLIVDLATAEPGCFGARMTGAGFGGCAVALVHRTAAAPFVERVRAAYLAETGIDPGIYVTEAAEGASLWRGEGVAR